MLKEACIVLSAAWKLGLFDAYGMHSAAGAAKY
jgi:hypothetical protein